MSADGNKRYCLWCRWKSSGGKWFKKHFAESTYACKVWPSVRPSQQEWAAQGATSHSRHEWVVPNASSADTNTFKKCNAVGMS